MASNILSPALFRQITTSERSASSVVPAVVRLSGVPKTSISDITAKIQPPLVSGGTDKDTVQTPTIGHHVTPDVGHLKDGIRAEFRIAETLQHLLFSWVLLSIPIFETVVFWRRIAAVNFLGLRILAFQRRCVQYRRMAVSRIGWTIQPSIQQACHRGHERNLRIPFRVLAPLDDSYSGLLITLRIFTPVFAGIFPLRSSRTSRRSIRVMTKLITATANKGSVARSCQNSLADMPSPSSSSTNASASVSIGSNVS